MNFADVLYNFITENLYKKLLDSIDAISNCVSCNYDFVIHLYLDISCTGGSIFSSCGPGCRQTCDTVNSLETCNKACVPGCHCSAGFVWHQNKCILQFDCPNFKKKKK